VVPPGAFPLARGWGWKSFRGVLGKGVMIPGPSALNTSRTRQ
jgi:hypothetical protein